jgi:hypothetical protein
VFGFVRALIKLALVALVVHAGVKIVPVFWNYVRFRDACEEIAKFSSKKTEADIKSRVLAKASQFEVPLIDESVKVRKQGAATFISADYTGQLEYFPSRFYPYDFAVKVQGAPPAYGEYIP